MDKKHKLKVGDRVELVFMNDSLTKLQKGDHGTVFKIEETPYETLIWVNWDNGEKLALLDGIDKYKPATK